jgi:hypothetical protein
MMDKGYGKGSGKGGKGKGGKGGMMGEKGKWVEVCTNHVFRVGAHLPSACLP